MESTTANRLRSIKLWPPSHKTRLLLVERIVKRLTTPSLLSRKYGLISKEEAEEQAKQIDSSAFETANQHFEKEPDGDGASAVQVYAKESSTLIVEAVKKGPSQKGDQEPMPESKPEPVTTIQEAEEQAKQIDSSAFETANQHFEKEPDGDGASAVQVYAKESSTLIVEAVKKGPSQKGDQEPMPESKPEPVTTIQETFFEKEPDGDGASAVQVYAKESSTLIVEAVKKGPSEKGDQEPIPESKPEPVTTIQETFFDISGGARDYIEADEATELLKALTEPGNKFTKICFSNRSFGLDAAHVAAPILSSINKQLTEVDLSDFIAGRPEAEALEVMTIFSESLKESDLKYLNLSNNALGEKGVRAFGQLLASQGNLEELYLMNDGISEEAAKAVCELIPSTKKLKVLHFHNNMTSDEGAIAIAQLVKESPLLEDFRCSSTRVGSEGGAALAESLGTCKNLKKLDLRDNMFGVEAGIALSQSIPVFVNLTEIHLSYLNLEDEGTLVLVNALKNSKSALEVLEMAGNDFTYKAAPALASCITSEKSTLTKLILSENELKDEGAIVIANAIKDGFDRLIEVDLSTNAIRTAGARVLSQAVVGKSGFKLLNINGNFLSDEGVDNVKEVFKNFPSVLGPLDENDPEGEDYDEEEEEEEEEEEGELESKLKDLEIKQDE